MDETGENDRPTVSPPFDPAVFAREVLRPSPQPIPAVPSRPTPMGLGIPAPPRSRPGAEGRSPSLAPPPPPLRRKTPTSTLSLVNTRVPSNLPPRPDATRSPAGATKRPAYPGSLDASSRERKLEIETRPPPGDIPDLAKEDQEEDDHAVATVRRPVPQDVIQGAITEREMTDRVSLGDYSGALEIAEKLLAKDPEHKGARSCAESCRAVLRQMYAARIGPLDRVPIVMVARDQLRWLSIDHKAGFVLSLVDGVSSLEMIIDVSGMPELETLRILSELAQQRIISLR